MRIKLITWQKINGYKGKEVAKMLGITEQTWCNIINGKSNPSIELAYKFSEIFGEIDVLDLFRKEGE